MNEKGKKKASAPPPYVSKAPSPKEEPDYKELYFKLLNEFENIRSYIRMIQDKSVNDFNKSFKPTYMDINKIDI